MLRDRVGTSIPTLGVSQCMELGPFVPPLSSLLSHLSISSPRSLLIQIKDHCDGTYDAYCDISRNFTAAQIGSIIHSTEDQDFINLIEFVFSSLPFLHP